MAGITTPFTTPNFPFLQTVSQRTLDNITPAFVLAKGPTVTPVGTTPNAGLGQGVFTVDGTLGSGYAQQWNVSVQRELTTNTVVEVSYLGSKITNIGIPDSNANQLTEEQLKLGTDAPREGPQPLFRDHSPVVLDRRPDDHAGAAPQTLSGLHGGQLLSEQRRHDELSGSRVQHSAADVARPDLLGRLHAFEADGHRFVGVRRVDSDRTADELRRRRQSQSGARPRLLDRRHSALLRLLGRVGSPAGRAPCQAPRAWSAHW